MSRQGPHRRFAEDFKRRAVERMQTADKITELAKELKILPWYLYRWEAELKGKPRKRSGRRQVRTKGVSQTSSAELERENAELRQALGKRALEVEFFKGALQKIEARRQRKGNSGETASTTRSEK